MNILVTGANGFIGKNVCKYFNDKGENIFAVDLHNEPRCVCSKYFCCDISTKEVNEIFKNNKINFVVHLASDMRHEPFTVEVVRNNCESMQRLLTLSEEYKISAFVELSSLPVIGSPTKVPVKENHPIKPPTVYHVTKYTQELLAEYAHYTFGLRTVSLRICAPVGEGVNPKTIFPTFVKRAIRNEDLTLIGKGGRKQTYIHVLDIARAIYKSIYSNAQGVYNLASYNLISNYELALKCIELTKSKSKIVFLDREDPEEDRVWSICIDKLKTDTGFEPVVSINEAIIEYAEILRKEL